MEREQKELQGFTGYQKFVVVLLTFLQFTITIDFSIISPLGDILMKELEINPSQFGLLVSSYAFGAGISGILVTAFADRFDRKKLLLVFYMGFIIGTLFCSLSDNYQMLLIARSITGVFGGIISSISLSIITDLFTLSQRGRVMAYIRMAFAGSQVLGIPVGILLANQWGWNSTFIMIVILSLGAYIVTLLKLRPLKEHLKLQTEEKNPIRRFWSILSNQNYLIGFLLIAISSIGGSMLMPFSSAFLINNIGITQEQLPLVFMFTGLATILVMPMVGKISDKIDRFKLFAIGSAITIIITLIYTNLTPIPLWLIIIINICLFTGISSRMIPAASLNTAIPEIRDRGSYMSLCSSLQQVSNGVAAMIAGLIIVQPSKGSPLENYNILGFIVISLGIVCLFLVYRINKSVLAKVKRV